MRKSSTYAAKGKPMPYSDLYQRWRSAALAGRTDEAAELSRQHQIRFGNVPSIKSRADLNKIAPNGPEV